MVVGTSAVDRESCRGREAHHLRAIDCPAPRSRCAGLEPVPLVRLFRRRNGRVAGVGIERGWIVNPGRGFDIVLELPHFIAVAAGPSAYRTHWGIDYPVMPAGALQAVLTRRGYGDLLYHVAIAPSTVV